MSQTVRDATPALQRQLGLWSATALVVSNMIGTGIFTTTGFLAGDLGQPWIVLGIWVVGAMFALAGARGSPGVNTGWRGWGLGSWVGLTPAARDSGGPAYPGRYVGRS